MRAVVIAMLLATATAAAQPVDTARAKELYQSAETAMSTQDYELAIRDYGAAYEISKDPALFYKLGIAHERAGKCSVAVVYYRRYLVEGKPTPAFVDITNARITACEPVTVKPEPATTEPAKAPEPTPEPTAPTPEPSKPAPASPDDKPSANTAMGGFVGSNDAKADTKGLSPRNRGAWLFVTGSIALFTVGAVLAYSADSAENDIDDLYVGFGGQPPVFDKSTRQLYDDLVAEGRRYERLSWVSFGLAGATAATAAVLFWRESKREKTLTITPTATKTGAGVSAVLSF